MAEPPATSGDIAALEEPLNEVHAVSDANATNGLSEGKEATALEIQGTVADPEAKQSEHIDGQNTDDAERQVLEPAKEVSVDQIDAKVDVIEDSSAVIHVQNQHVVECIELNQTTKPQELADEKNPEVEHVREVVQDGTSDELIDELSAERVDQKHDSSDHSEASALPMDKENVVECIEDPMGVSSENNEVREREPDEHADENGPEVEHVSAMVEDGKADDDFLDEHGYENAVDPMKPDFEYTSLENQDDLDDARSDEDDVDMLHASPHHITMSASSTVDDEEDHEDEHELEEEEEENDDIDRPDGECDEDQAFDGDYADGEEDDGGDSLAEDCEENDSGDALAEDVEEDNCEEAEESDDIDDDADMIIPDMLVHPPKAGKKRRRILAITSANEDSSGGDEHREASDDERLRSLSAASSAAADFDGSADDLLTDERLEAIVKNEKPGPKSMKQSTQLLKEREARALLQSAVVIPVSADAAKKRKIRVLESDDDGDATVLGLTSVDDIGIDDVIDADRNDGALCAELFMADSMLVLPDVVTGAQTTYGDDELDVKDVVLRLEDFERTHDDETIPEQKCMVKMEFSESETAAAVYPHTSKVDGRNGSKNKASTTAVKVKDEPRTPKASAAQKARYSLCSSSSDEYVPNDVYFGTPDRNSIVQKPIGRGRGRGGGRGGGRGASSARYEEERKHRERHEKTTRGRGRGRGRPPGQKSKSFRQQYAAESDSSEPSSSSESDNPAHRRKTPVKKSRNASYDQHKADLSTKTKRKGTNARFKDKARTIPNDVYFDSKVPLHVLYSYGTEESSEEDLPPFPPLSTITGRTSSHKSATYKPRGSRGRCHTSTRGKSASTAPPMKANTSSSRITETASTSKRGRKPGYGKTNADFRLKHLKKCFRAAGFQKIRFKELWQDCDTSMERSDKIMQLLRDNGLEGEPTIDNCRLLRKEVVTNEEVRELDPSLIIKTEGRTRRSTALAATQPTAQSSTATAAADDDTTMASTQCADGIVTPTVLTKIKTLIDSDSDDE